MYVAESDRFHHIADALRACRSEAGHNSGDRSDRYQHHHARPPRKRRDSANHVVCPVHEAIDEIERGSEHYRECRRTRGNDDQAGREASAV
jgi:hypothetical protein